MNFLNKIDNNNLIIRFLPIINLFLGVAMFFPFLISPQLRLTLNEFTDIWIWGIVLTFGSLVGFFTTRRNEYIVTVTIPLLLFATILWRGFFSFSTSFTGVTTYTLLGILSFVFANRILK